MTKKDSYTSPIENQEKFRDLVESSHDWIWEVDTQARYTYVSPRVKDLLGYEVEDIIGKTPFDLMPAEEAQRVAKIFGDLAAEHRPFNALENVHLHSNGSRIVFETNGVPIFSADGEFLGYRGADRNITERVKAQQALQHSELHLRAERDFVDAVVEAAGTIIVVLDRNGCIVRFNHAAEKITGYSFEEILGRPIWEYLIPPEIRQDVEGVFNNLTTGKIIGSYENEWLMKDGSRRLFDWRNTVLKNTSNEITHVVSQGYDITAIRKTQHALAEHKNKLEQLVAERTTELEDITAYNRTLFKTSPIGLALCDMEGKLVDVNPAYLEIIGYTETEVKALSYWDITPREFETQEQLQLESLKQSGRYGPYQKEYLHKDGHRVSVQLSGLHIEQGGDQYIWSSVEDITERQKTERDLQHFKSTLDHTQDCVFMFTPDTLCFYYVNQGAVNQVGHSHTELMQMTLYDLEPEIDEIKFREFISPLLNGDTTSVTFETLHRHKQGHDIPVETVLQYITPADEASTFIAIVRDITEHKATEQAMTEAKQKAEAAVQAKSEFLANMSHEIRTPLNAVLGLARMGKHASSAEKALEIFELISDSGQNLFHVVNDILDFSKIEAGKFTLENQPFNLIHSVQNVADLIKIQANDKGLLFSQDIADDLPLWVKGDAMRLRQILLNLFSNAIKFTEKGEIKFRVRKQKNALQFQVSDTGIGISESQLKHLFKPFEQADNSTTRRFGGTGLGLSISFNLAMMMGGDIQATSQLGTGSVFTINLDLKPTAPIIEPSSKTQDTTEQRLHGINILVAEDIEINRLVLDDMLMQEGAHVSFAENGQRALDLLEEEGANNFDVVLMDIQMPVMDGHEATQYIQKIAPRLPVIGLTAHALAEEKKRCLASGMVDHIAKPVEPDELITAIQKQIMRTNSPSNSAKNEPITETNDEESRLYLPSEADAVIDWPALKIRYQGNNKIIRKLITTLLRTHKETPEKLHRAVSNKDTETLYSISHSLKGISGYLEAHELHKLAEQTQEETEQNKTDNIQIGTELANSMDKLLVTLSTIMG